MPTVIEPSRFALRRETAPPPAKDRQCQFTPSDQPRSMVSDSFWIIVKEECRIIDANHVVKSFAQAEQPAYQKDVELSGTVEGADLTNGTFRLRLKNGAVVTVPLPDAFRESVRAADGNTRTMAIVKGRGVFYAWNNMPEVAAAKRVEVVPNAALADELKELQKLKDGWYEGQGKSPDAAQLDWVTKALVKGFPAKLRFPLVAPTSDGGLFLEWIQKPWRVSAEFPLPSHLVELQATNTVTGESVEDELDLDEADNWPALFKFVLDHI